MPSKSSFDVKIQSLNVRGLNKSIKRRSIFRWLHNQKFHFIFLQETYSSKDCAQIWEAEWGGRVFFSHGSSHSRGVMTLVNPNLDFKVEKCIYDTNGRFLILDLLIDEFHVILVNIYAPNDASQQVTFFKELENQLDDFSQENIIIAGDFNCALSENDKKGGNPVWKKSIVIKEIQQLANLYNLTDIWRDRNPNDNRFTWRNKSLKIQCRLDFFLISKELSNDTHGCNIINAPETDHSAITLHLKTEDLLQPKGPGFWKFNNSLLDDENYTSKIRESLPVFKDKYADLDDLRLKWDLIKMEIRGFTIKYSKIKAKNMKNEEVALQNKVNELVQKCEQNPSDKRILNELYATKLRLQAIMRQKTKGAILRSKARWHELGERNSRYFFNLERRNHSKKTVTSLKLRNNSLTHDQSEILQEQKTFFEALYKSQNTQDNLPDSDLFNSGNIEPLDENDKIQCEGMISEEECLTALKEFQSNKTPGTDGFSAEFYKFFWNDLGTEMTASFNHAFQTGSLSISQKRGIISLIPKKNKEATLLENLRPISLLNVDYKILTKSIAKRLEKVLPKIINSDQTGYIKGRFIGENVRLIQDVMFYTKREEQPGIAIFLDFRKAFDTIEWNYLQTALKTFNFGPDMLNWFQVIYHQVSSCVLHNGHASDFFLLERGVRQGCPLSGLLFVVGIELLARALKKDPTIKGIKVDQKEIKITQYADDTTVLVRDLDSVTQLLKRLDEFKHISGLEINTNKTEALWLGCWRSRKDKPFGFKWPQKPVYALGIHFSYDSEQANTLNFEEKVRSLEKTLNNWKKRKLTLLGRINIVKTLGLSKLIYCSSLLAVSKSLIDRINKIIFDFIWESKPPKIKKKTIIAEKRCGGLKMVDFEIMERSLKVAWIKRIAESGNASWKIIPNQAVSHCGGLEFLIKCDYDPKLLNLEMPEFYQAILNYWYDLRCLTCDKEISIRKQIIWNNRNIRIDGKSIFINSWYVNGIHCIEDLLDENLKFLPLSEMKQKYNLEFPFTTYYGLLKAIPTEWKRALRVTVSEHSESQNEKTSELFSTKNAYSAMLSKSFSAPTAEGRIFNHGFTKDTIRNVYMLPFKILKDPKLIMFQVKVIHNILPTQSSLFHARITDSEVCPLCNRESQSLRHMLITCSVSSSFWTIFSNWWQEKFNQRLTLSESTVLYGWHKESSNWEVLNYCLIVAKYHIFATSVRNGILDFDSFLLRLNDKIAIPRTIAGKSNRLEQFEKTWSSFVT